MPFSEFIEILYTSYQCNFGLCILNLSKLLDLHFLGNLVEELCYYVSVLSNILHIDFLHDHRKQQKFIFLAIVLLAF
jgi:hypothetical protein